MTTLPPNKGRHRTSSSRRVCRRSESSENESAAAAVTAAAVTAAASSRENASVNDAAAAAAAAVAFSPSHTDYGSLSLLVPSCNNATVSLLDSSSSSSTHSSDNSDCSNSSSDSSSLQYSNDDINDSAIPSPQLDPSSRTAAPLSPRCHSTHQSDSSWSAAAATLTSSSISNHDRKSEDGCRSGANFVASISNDNGLTTTTTTPPSYCDLNSDNVDVLAKQQQQRSRSRAVDGVSVDTERLDAKLAKSKMKRDEEPMAMTSSSVSTNRTSAPVSDRQSPRRAKSAESLPGEFFVAKSSDKDGATTSPPPPLPFCGLGSVDADDALAKQQRSRVVVITEHLDAKIASKMKGEDPLAGSSLSNRISRIDSEIQSKECRPGAFSATAISGDGAQTMSFDLSTVESDILVKQRSRVFVVTEHLDAKIESKMRGEAPVCSTASSTPNKHTDDRTTSHPGSVAENVNDMIAAKIRRDSQPAIRTELRNLEGAIQTKLEGTRTESSLVVPAHAALQSLESRIAAKVHRCTGSASPKMSRLEQGLQNLEDKIQANMSGNASPLVAHTDADACESSNQQPEDEAQSKYTNSSVALALETLDLIVTSKMSGYAMSRRDDETQDPSECMSIFSCDSIKSPRREAFASENIQSINGLRYLDGVEESESEFQRESSNRDLRELYDVELGGHGGLADEDLVVAFAVEEDDSDIFYPSAVQYNPDAKPPIHRNRRFRLYSFLLYSAVVIGIVGTVVGILLSDIESLPPALPDRSTLGIREYAERLVGVEVLGDVTNPYRKALEWIQFVDPMALTPDSVKFTQRFLIAYFYFSTSVDMNWTNGCEPSDVESVKCTYMFRGGLEIDLKNAVDATRWLSSEDECTWGGVYCDRSGQVNKLDFSGSNMTAPSFPEGLVRLPQLQHLALNFGEIKGALPAVLGDMKHCRVLEMAGNAFRGTIPESWYNSRSFQKVNVGRNLLTGTISRAVRQLKDLTGFIVNNNQLMGRIPDFPVGVNWLMLDSNALTGSIPSGLGRLSQLKQLILFRNKLQFTLPPQIGLLTNLVELRVQGNELTGSFPNEWTKLHQLWSLELSSNKLTGDILPKLVNMTKLEVLRIDNNLFSGTFPREVSELKDLVHMVASGNAFSGLVGPRICNMMKPKNNKVTSKSLIELKLDCAIQSNGSVEISCPCCSHCCDGDGTKCSATGFEG